MISQKNLSPSRSTIYYGANDGTLRAVDTVTGRERWAFFAPKFFARTVPSATPTNVFARMRNGSPQTSFPPLAPSEAFQPMDYFFDGSLGAFQSADNSIAWIYATQRRGGRMIYAFDVSSPDAPLFKWRAGCPNLGNDTGCTAGMSRIGQTWSTPSVAFIKGYSTTTPVVLVGGGYDACEDADTASPSGASPRGNTVYILDGANGNVIASFATERSVTADIALVDVNYDGFVDYAYVADLRGDLYRIDFVATAAAATPLASSQWTMRYVAYTSSAGPKFHYAPSLLPSGGKVCVALGSGDREKPLQSSYPFQTPVTNRFYVYLDDLALSPAGKGFAINLDNALVMANSSATTSCAVAGVLPNSSARGWFMDLAAGTGEQTVTSAVIVGGLVAFSTNRPIPPVEGTCSSTLGEARGYWLNLPNASGAGEPQAPPDLLAPEHRQLSWTLQVPRSTQMSRSRCRSRAESGSASQIPPPRPAERSRDWWRRRLRPSRTSAVSRAGRWL